MDATRALAKVVHGAAHHLIRPLHHRYGGPVPVELLVEPKHLEVPYRRGKLHTLEWGAGDPVILLHGLNANARYWTGVACLLASTHRVICPDLRGHGQTGALPGGYSHEETRFDLHHLADAMELEAFDLVGHSWGGKVALDYAAAFPSRVRRLVLVDPVLPEGLHPLIQRVPALVSIAFEPERRAYENAAELAAARTWISWLRRADPWMHDAFLASFEESDSKAYRPILSEDGFDQIMHTLADPSPLSLTDVTMPTLLVRATFSVMAFGQWHELARRLPHMLVERVYGEHCLHATNPLGLSRALRTFLNARMFV